MDTLTVELTEPTGEAFFMKFRTDGAWGTRPDFGTCFSETDTLGLSGVVCPAADGPALPILFPVTAEYEFTLDERTQIYTIRPLTEIVFGSLSGLVTYEDDPTPAPQTIIAVFPAGTQTPIGIVTAEEDGSFLVENLSNIQNYPNCMHRITMR